MIELKKLIILLSLVLIFLISCTIPTETECQTKLDCVPASCCHPDKAVNKNYAPDCEDIFCTEECRPETLDCNQGKIGCINNRCEVILN